MNLSEQLKEVRSKKLKAIAEWDILMHERCVDYKSTDLARKEGYQKGLVAGYSYMETFLVNLLERLGNGSGPENTVKANNGKPKATSLRGLNELKEIYNVLNKTINDLYKIAVKTDDKTFQKLNTLIIKISQAQFYLDDEILSDKNDIK